MNDDSLEKLKYPIGKFVAKENYSYHEVEQLINDIATFPSLLYKTTENLSDSQLDTPYRPDGWTIRQLIHHCSDSHANAYIRLKLALTEEEPVVKPYLEEKWAELPDSKLPIEASLKMIESIHYKWVVLMQHMQPHHWERTYFHPQSQMSFTLHYLLDLYAWHCRHHFMHIQNGLLQK